MLTSFKKIVRNEFPELFEKKVYLACSGGMDSMALSYLLLQLNIKHTLLHCNFQLRDQESKDDQKFVEDYASKNDLMFQTIDFNTLKEVELRGTNIQETARNLRYEWFNKIIPSKGILLTAHHLDDSIETFFINLLRGTGLRGLTGISSQRKNIRRPLLSFSKSDIKEFVSRSKISFREDSSNQKNEYLRNKLRNEILPLLKEEEPSFTKKISHTLYDLNQTQNWIDKCTLSFKEKYFNQQGDFINISYDLSRLNRIELENIFREFDVKRSSSNALFNFIKTSVNGQFILKKHILFKSREEYVIIKTDTLEEVKKLNTICNNLPAKINIGPNNLILEEITTLESFDDSSHIQIDLKSVNFPLTIRRWKTGDKIIPLGMTGRKLISDILTDKKVSSVQREFQLCIIDANATIICAPLLVVSNGFRVSSRSKSILKISYSYN